MKQGQDGARSDDTATLKKSIIEMLRAYDHDMSKGLDERNKANRGFNHPLTGRLLCPAKLDYTDERY
jgi:Family of unknown function (DUF6698)